MLQTPFKDPGGLEVEMVSIVIRPWICWPLLCFCKHLEGAEMHRV